MQTRMEQGFAAAADLKGLGTSGTHVEDAWKVIWEGQQWTYRSTRLEGHGRGKKFVLSFTNEPINAQVSLYFTLTGKLAIAQMWSPKGFRTTDSMTEVIDFVDANT